MNSLPQPTGYDWLATGGAYYLLAASWVISAVFFSVLGMRSATAAKAEADGCLMLISGSLLAFTGGGVGLYLGTVFTRYPNFVLTSIVLCVLFPAVGTYYLLRKIRKHR